MQPTKAKQQFLREEIVDKGYSKQKFILFLASKNKNPEQLHSWTLPEIREMVEDFKTEQTHTIIRHQNTSQCPKQARLEPVAKIKVRVVHRKKQFFLQSQDEFLINCGRYRKPVRREFQHVRWLQQSLLRQFPGFDIQHSVDESQASVQGFFDCVAAMPTISRSYTLHQFLDQKQDAQFLNRYKNSRGRTRFEKSDLRGILRKTRVDLNNENIDLI